MKCIPSQKIIWKLGFLLLICIGFMGSCTKKSGLDPITRNDRNPDDTKFEDTQDDLLKDSVYLYTYYVYLWQESLPAQFATRSYATPEAVLEELMQYAKDPSGEVYDRYSFLDRLGTVSDEIEEGRSGNFGLDVRYHNETDLYIKRVYAGSPAGLAGIERGWKVEAINGQTNLDAASLEANDFGFLWDALDAPSIDLKLRSPDGILQELHLNSGNYRIDPILHDEIYEQGGKKIGYFVFDSFIATENATGQETYVKQALDDLFQEFSAAGVEEVIVDLRYNGGGAVATAEYLSNLLVPSSGNNQAMYTYVFNDWLKEDGFDEIFSPVQFNKPNTLSPNRVYFLVTEGTASASELLINNLKPYVDVKLIGENHTYGKPVGFFPISIFDTELYAVSFKTENAEKESDYFSGMLVDKNTSEDVRKNWGDKDEALIAQALKYASTGQFSMDVSLQASRGPRISVAARVQEANQKLNARERHEMIDFRQNIHLNRLDSNRIQIK